MKVNGEFLLDVFISLSENNYCVIPFIREDPSDINPTIVISQFDVISNPNNKNSMVYLYILSGDEELRFEFDESSYDFYNNNTLYNVLSCTYNDYEKSDEITLDIIKTNLVEKMKSFGFVVDIEEDLDRFICR